MAARTLDAIVMETMGLKEMTIARLLWEVEDLKAQLAKCEAELSGLKGSQQT